MAGTWGGASGKDSACHFRRRKRCGFDPWVGKRRSGRDAEKEMASHSSILAGRTPWTEKPGGLQSMGLQKSQT